jgi:HNH endonuclease
MNSFNLILGTTRHDDFIKVEKKSKRVQREGFNSYKADSRGYIVNSKGKRLKGTKNEQGYIRVALTNDTGVKKFYVHRLIALHFHECPSEEYEVHHKDGKRDNNKAENLEWVTHQENMKHVQGWKNKKWIKKATNGKSKR